MDYLVRIGRHHNVEAGPYYNLVNADTLESALIQGFEIALEEMGQYDLGAQRDKLVAAVAEIRDPAPVPKYESSGRFAQLRLYEDGVEPPKEGEEDNDSTMYLLWHDAPGRPGDEPNIGIGYGRPLPPDNRPRLVGKEDNRWLTITPWDGNPKRRAELEALPKERIIDLLVRLEAVH